MHFGAKREPSRSADLDGLEAGPRRLSPGYAHAELPLPSRSPLPFHADTPFQNLFLDAPFVHSATTAQSAFKSNGKGIAALFYSSMRRATTKPDVNTGNDSHERQAIKATCMKITRNRLFFMALGEGHSRRTPKSRKQSLRCVIATKEKTQR